MGFIWRWAGEEATARTINAAFDALVGVAEEAYDKITADMEKPSPPPSRPGEAPHKVTTGFADQVGLEVDEQEHRVRLGTNSKALAAKEFGNSQEDARPWLSIAVGYMKDAAVRDPRRFAKLRERVQSARREGRV